MENGVKFFATLELLGQAKDRTWPAKITNALNQYWQKKNAAKKASHSQMRFQKFMQIALQHNIV